jgi:hypothetical protein
MRLCLLGNACCFVGDAGVAVLAATALAALQVTNRL